MLESNYYLKTVIETMQDGLMVVDTGGIIVSVNRAMEELTGYSRAELIGNHCSILECDTCFSLPGRGPGQSLRAFIPGQAPSAKMRAQEKGRPAGLRS